MGAIVAGLRQTGSLTERGMEPWVCFDSWAATTWRLVRGAVPPYIGVIRIYDERKANDSQAQRG
jgi:hypothetical protein